MRELYQFIIEKILKSDIDRETGIELLSKIKKEDRGYSDKIAIVGIAAHYPNADNLDEFWDVLANGKDCMGEFPANRKNDINEYVKDKYGTYGGNIYTKGGYLSHIDLFDHDFFKIPYKEAERMDPNQRIFLQTAYEALEDAGYGGDAIKGTKTGVFLGYSNSLREDYVTYVKCADIENNSISIQANLESIIPSRLSYFLDLKGPSITFDTACSSSLVAITSAMDSLRKKESDMAIVAGMKINFFLLENGVKLGIESKRVQTRSFDNLADGVGVGEGIGVVVLKKFDDAIRDKDHIYAIILGSACNQDGYSAGITVPNVDSQREVLISAWENANISPETISYIETHGTGTKIGDPIEVEALTSAFARFTDKKQFCGIGSVKSNLGHLYEGAGMVSFIKAVLSLYKKKIPASLHFQIPNDRIDWCNSPVYVNDDLVDWEAVTSSSGEVLPRRCGISAFGLSGTNCHIVLEEYNNKELQHKLVEKSRLFVLSSCEYDGLRQLASKYCEYLKNVTDIDLDAFCNILYVGRGHYNHRLAFYFDSKNDLLKKLNCFVNGGSAADGINGIHYKQIIMSIDYSEIGTRVCVTTNKIEAFNEQVKGLFEQGIQSELICDLYTKGAMLPWEILVCKEAGVKMRLPLYAFKPTRCWLKYNPKQISDVTQVEDIKKILLDKPVIKNDEVTIYQCTLSSERDFVLTDHVVMGKNTLPGTAYIEIACEIAQKYMNIEQIQMNGFKFMTPIILDKFEERTINISVTKSEAEYILLFKSQKNGVEYLHAEVNVSEHQDRTQRKLQIDLMCEQAQIVKTIDQNELTKGFIHFGKHWLNYHKIYLNDDEGIAYLKMLEEVRHEKYEFIFPPSLVDMGVNAMSLLLGEAYLPLYYKKIKVYNSLPDEIYSYVKKKEKNSNNNETMTYDIVFTDITGNVLAEFEDYTVKKVRDVEKFGKAISISGFNWIKSVGKEVEDVNDVLILGSNSRRSQDLWDELISNGKKAIYVRESEEMHMFGDEWQIPYNNEGYHILIEKIIKDNEYYSNIVYFVDYDKDAMLNEDLEKDILKVFEFTKELCRINFKTRFTIVTEYAYRVIEADNKINMIATMLTGLSRTLNAEKRGIVTQCVDFDSSYTSNDLIQALKMKVVVDYVAYRNNIRYEPQIDLIDYKDNNENKVQLRKNGVYIITGGCGAIGIKTAELLSKHENINIILVNRKQFEERDKWNYIIENDENSESAFVIRTVLKIEESGSYVYFKNADVSEEEQVKALITEVTNDIGTIRGIIHSAGVAGGGLIQNKEWSEISRVFAPKVKGAYYLDKYVDYENLDFMLLFSSIASLAPTPGQLDYSMANIYLDAFSEYGMVSGKKIITVNWPAWNDVGMAVKYQNINEKFIHSINSNDAMYALWIILNNGYNHVVVGEWNKNEIKDIKGINLGKNLQDLVQDNSHNFDRTYSKQKINVILEGRLDDNYTEEERIISEIWANVLGLNVVNIYSNFNDIGGNSIFAVKMLDMLNEKYPNMFDVTDMFSYSTIYQLAEHIREVNSSSEKNNNVDLNDAIINESDQVELEEHDELEEMLKKLQNGEVDISELDNMI